MAVDVTQSLWFTAASTSRREWLYYLGLKSKIPREIFWLVNLSHMSPLNQSAVIGGITWTICRDVVWKGWADKTMGLANLYTYPLSPHGFCCAPCHLYPPYTRGKTLTKWNKKSQALNVCYDVHQRPLREASHFWAAFLYVIETIRWYEVHNIWRAPAGSFSSSPFSQSLEERDARKWGKVNSLLESWPGKSYILFLFFNHFRVSNYWFFVHLQCGAAIITTWFRTLFSPWRETPCPRSTTLQFPISRKQTASLFPVSMNSPVRDYSCSWPYLALCVWLFST